MTAGGKYRKALLALTSVTLLTVSGAGAAPAAAVETVAVRAQKLYTMAGPAIEDGVVVVENGKVVAAGPAASVSIPDGATVLTAAVATPGLVDAHTVVGLSGYLNQPHDQDQLETSSPMQPQLRAIDAYNAREKLVSWLRSFGITTIHTGHGPGALISGQTLVAKTRGESVDEAVFVPEAMIASNLGPDAFGEKDKSPGTRAKEMAMLRAELLKAADYRRKANDAKGDKAPDRDLEMEAVAALLDRKVPLLVTANRAQDILSALRLAREFDLRIVLDGAAEAYLVLDEIRAAGVPVILHPTMARSFGDRENLSFETASKLLAAGIPFALQSGYEGYVPKTRVVLFEAAVAAANGLTFEQALAAVTIDAAKIVGVADRVGSLEPGKDGDIALFDGDPFEYTSHVIGVVIEGDVVSEEQR